MRVTDKILQNNLIANLMFSSERLYDREMKVLTNKRINKPSDDPVGTLNSLVIRDRLGEIEQYQRNIARTKTMLQNTESVVTQVAEVFQRANTLTIQGASDGFGPEDKLSISYEINQILEQVLKFANNRSESSYLFGGVNNDNPPYLAARNAQGEITGVTTSGTGGDQERVIGENVSIKVNINGEDLFESGQNLFDLLVDIRTNLQNNDSVALSQNLTQLDEAMERIYNTQSILGSRMNRLEAAEARSENDKVNFTEFLSNVEDVDAASAIMDYQMELATLQASLQAGARLIHPRLMDFLR